MAVAPLNNVRRVAEYALTRIPAEKLFWGMPTYGYNRTLPYVRCGVLKLNAGISAEPGDIKCGIQHNKSDSHIAAHH